MRKVRKLHSLVAPPFPRSSMADAVRGSNQVQISQIPLTPDNTASDVSVKIQNLKKAYNAETEALRIAKKNLLSAMKSKAYPDLQIEIFNIERRQS